MVRTCIRPHTVCGIAFASPLNIISVVGAYAAISKELNLPLKFPGSPKAFSAVYQATDARLLCRAVQWALQSPRCANQAFNITNGDFFRWENLWPRIASHFEMELGRIQDVQLAKVMADKGSLWKTMIARHGLRTTELDKLVTWSFGDYVFHTEWDVMASTTKARQFGFGDCLDTEDMFLEILQEMQNARVIP